MQSHAFVDHTDEINSVYALIPIIAYCYQQDSHLSEMQIKKLVKWFYYSQTMIMRRWAMQTKTGLKFTSATFLLMHSGKICKRGLEAPVRRPQRSTVARRLSSSKA